MSLPTSTIFKLYPHQIEAVKKLSSGSLLYGLVGSGKTLTALAYVKEHYSDYPVYVITTAKKRDTNDWEAEAEMIGVRNVKVDSWNNITKYLGVKRAFFIFDEQRVVGYGTWTKSFLKISNQNPWILLSGTPGDTWTDYMPLFIANHFYKNKTSFINQHVEFDRYAKFPKIKAYHNTEKLEQCRKAVTVKMNYRRKTIRRRKYEETSYDEVLYSKVVKERFNPFTEEPIKTPSEYTQVLRRIVSVTDDRLWKLLGLIKLNKKVILYYNYNYERDEIRALLDAHDILYSEYSGHKHQDIPKGDRWVYVVHYTSGAEGWNCTDTDTMIFYSPNYSYRVVEQCEGRIDRLNTKYEELFYYFMRSKSSIDTSVFRALANKKKFNEKNWGEG